MLSRLERPKGARQRRKRVGRGPGSGHGKTSTRGHKGAGQRSGKESGPRFEGGQTVLYRRIPKRGFRNPHAERFEVVNLSRLNRFNPGEVVNPEVLVQLGWVKPNLKVKILGDGELKVGLRVEAHRFSRSAQKKIEASGGSWGVIS